MRPRSPPGEDLLPAPIPIPGLGGRSPSLKIAALRSPVVP